MNDPIQNSRSGHPLEPPAPKVDPSPGTRLTQAETQPEGGAKRCKDEPMPGRPMMPDRAGGEGMAPPPPRGAIRAPVPR